MGTGIFSPGSKAAGALNNNNNQYCAGDKIEKYELDGACSAEWGERVQVLVGKPKEKRPLG
jgi:hypothetical protein